MFGMLRMDCFLASLVPAHGLILRQKVVEVGLHVD